MEWGSTWVLVLLVALVLLAIAQAGPDSSLSSQPLVVAASYFLTIPIAIFTVLATNSWGIILLPLAFIALIWYLRVLDVVLGEALLVFLVAAAAIVMLAR